MVRKTKGGVDDAARVTHTKTKRGCAWKAAHKTKRKAEMTQKERQSTKKEKKREGKGEGKKKKN